ncbi:MAG: hypothetical protein ACOXZ5_05350 [Syntrophomonadaceae bacterium]|jgi:hypothetical protein
MLRYKKNKKVFMGLAILVNVLLCLGLYINYQINNRSALISTPEPVTNNHITNSGNSEKINAGSGDNTEPDNLNDSPEALESKPWWSSFVTEVSEPDAKGGSEPTPEEITEIAETQLGKPVKKSDIVKVGAILVRKLSQEELTFCYNVAKNSDPSPTDIKKVKEILKDRLTSEELKLVQETGMKYGKKMKFE